MSKRSLQNKSKINICIVTYETLPNPITQNLKTFFWCIKFGKRWDIYFAAGNLNPVAGIILREIGVVKKVVYQCLDYFPTRFENKILNWLYFHLDKFCVRFSDETWNVSSVMAEARKEKMNMDPKIYNHQYTVP